MERYEAGRTMSHGHRGWRRTILSVLAAWNRNQIRRIFTAILVIWLGGSLLLHLLEPDNPSFASFGEALWNVWVALFAGMNNAPDTFLGRAVAVVVIVSGVALAGLFTASVASILIERSLRSRDVASLQMSGHLVLCNWSSRGLEWIREVHSSIVAERRSVVIIHDNPDEVDLPDGQDDPAFADVFIVKGDPANEVVLKRAKVPEAHSVVILSDDRQGPHADGKSVVCCIAVKAVCRTEPQPNIVVECRDSKFRSHLRRAGADEVLSASEFGLRLLARAALFHGMTRVYQELLTVGRDANELYMVPVPAWLIGKTFAETAGMFLADRRRQDACLLIGIYRGEKMMLNPVGGEAGPLHAGDDLVVLCPMPPDLSRYNPENVVK